MKFFLPLIILVMSISGPALARSEAEKNLARQLVADQGLFYALARGDVPGMITLRDQGADPNASLSSLGLTVREVFGAGRPAALPFDPRGWPVLHWAVYLNNLEAVKLLIRSGARVNTPDRYGATALHWAAWNGGHSEAKLLLNNGADVKALDAKGRTPKDWAIMMSQGDMIRLLDGRTRQPAPPRDADRDGVPDGMDSCPDTPYGAMVDERGCWVAAYANFFNFDKAEVLPQYLPHLADVAEVMKNHAQLKLSLLGFTDSKGTEEYNLKLGQRRAEAVRDILIKNGVAPERLSLLSRGEAGPLADNATAAGRARNRRVEIHISAPPGARPPKD